MKKKKPVKKNLTIQLDEKNIEFLRQLSFLLSAQERTKVGVGEIVRRALDSYCPIPEAPKK